MPKLSLVNSFLDATEGCTRHEQLHDILAQCCEEMRIRYFALLHHVDFAVPRPDAVRIHNYPSAWEEWLDKRRIGTSDPVLRASHSTHLGFPWSAVPRMIRMTAADESVLSQARIVGIGDGFTVPAHIPGEVSGSCSFAMPTGVAFPKQCHFLVQLIGGFAFEAARRITCRHNPWSDDRPTLSGRQVDCVLWVARGKSDNEIATILRISKETVIEHLKLARQRYGVNKRVMLVVRALFDGLISFPDLLRY